MKNKSLHNLTVCFKFAFIDWGKKYRRISRPAGI